MTSKFCPNSPWTNEAVARLKAIWLQYQTTSVAEIMNREFGPRFTTVTVALKASRLGLPKKLNGAKFAPRYIKRSAEQKGFQPLRFTPAIIVEPTKEQLAADKKLIEDHIATKGVTLCETATFIPLNHDFNRVARPRGSM